MNMQMYSMELGASNENTITLDSTVLHYPRRVRVPVALRDPLKEKLNTLTQQGIIARVDRPTDWVNSCVCVTKLNGKLRLCLDPKDLHKAIKKTTSLHTNDRRCTPEAQRGTVFFHYPRRPKWILEH